MIWLGRGLQGDDTDGHVDNVACFAGLGRVVALTAADPADADHAALVDNLQRLHAARDAHGRRLKVVGIEQPPARYSAGRPAVQSYINFYIANGGIVMPTFDDPPRDAAAAGALRELFPEREVVAVPAFDIIAGGGGIHCITQQEPLPQRGSRGPETGSLR